MSQEHTSATARVARRQGRAKEGEEEQEKEEEAGSYMQATEGGGRAHEQQHICAHEHIFAHEQQLEQGEQQTREAYAAGAQLSPELNAALTYN